MTTPSQRDPEAELVRALRAAGAGPWITDDLGRHITVEDYAVEFLDEVTETLVEGAQAALDQVTNILALLDGKTTKTISVRAIREALDVT